MKLEQYYNAAMRAQRQGRVLSGRDMLLMLGLGCLVVSAAFWLPVQWLLVSPQSPVEMVIAVAFGMFVVLAPPVFTSFFVPWSPSAQLLMRINFRTVGQAVALAVMIYLVYYDYTLMRLWWASRPETVAANMVMQQTLIAIICTVLTPALLWAPTSKEELEEILKQDQLVRRYELQTAADLAYLQGIKHDAEYVAAVGLAKAIATINPQMLGAQMQYLVEQIDKTRSEIAHNVEGIAHVKSQFPTLNPAERDDVRGILDYVAESLANPDTYIDVTPTREPIASTSDSARASAEPAVTTGSGSHAVAREVAREPSVDEQKSRDPFFVAREHFGDQPFTRRDVQDLFSCEQTKALDMIRSWRLDGMLHELKEPKHTYQFKGH